MSVDSGYVYMYTDRYMGNRMVFMGGLACDVCEICSLYAWGSHEHLWDRVKEGSGPWHGELQLFLSGLVPFFLSNSPESPWTPGTTELTDKHPHVKKRKPPQRSDNCSGQTTPGDGILYGERLHLSRSEHLGNQSTPQEMKSIRILYRTALQD